MRPVLIVILFSLSAFANSPDWTYVKDKVIYSAVVNNTDFKVYFSTGAFDPSKHKVTPLIENEDEVKFPTVDGHRAIGHDEVLPKAEDKYPHLTRLAVAFGDKVVEAPVGMISHIFNPSGDMSFDEYSRMGEVTISADGKTVTIVLGVGDASTTDYTAFTFTAEGKCLLSLPIMPTP